MASGWQPVSIELRGYRGVGERGLRIELDRALVVLEGPNGAGKSTIVSALEWALFGDLALSADVDVAELKGGGRGPRLLFLHHWCDEAFVRVRFERGEASLQWTRTRRRSAPTRDELECLLDGRPVEPDTGALLGVDHELYARAVAPGQGSLAALVSLESKERNAALDRLFGIEQLNALAVGLGAAKGELSREAGRLEERFDDLSGDIRREVAWWFDRRGEARERALEVGIPDEVDGASARGRIGRLAGALGLAPPADDAPVAALRALHAQLEAAATGRYVEPQTQRRLEWVLRVLGALESGPASRLDGARSSLELAERAREEVLAGTGTAEEVEERLREAERRLAELEDELEQAGERARVLDAAQGWLRRHEEDGELRCPVCERPILRRELAGLVEEGLAAAGEAAQALRRVRDEAQEARAAALADRRELADAEAELARCREAERSLLEEAADSLRPLVEELRRPRAEVDTELAAAVEALAERCGAGELAAAVAEAARLRQGCVRARDAAQAEARRASGEAERQRREVAALGPLLDLLEAEERLSRLDPLLSRPELEAARAGLEEARQAAEVVKAVAEALGEATWQEAEARVARVAPRLDAWFGRLSAHALLETASVHVERSRAGGRIRNAYRVRAADGRGEWEAGPGPLLSGGYQTALAVAALCALADPEVRGHGLELLVLDEPTQNLDRTLSERLAQALVQEPPAARTIVTTADPIFAEALERGTDDGTARVVHLEEWTQTLGVAVR